MKPHRLEQRQQAFTASFLFVLGLLVFSPLLLLFITSLKDDPYQILAELGSVKAFWVESPTLKNFHEVLFNPAGIPYGRYLVNSFIILAATVLGTTVLCSMFAYTMLRGKYRAHRLLLPLVLSLYIIPIEATLFPLLFIIYRSGLIDTYLAQILPFIASPLFVFLFYQFFKSIPTALSEAAKVEGASFFLIFRSIYLPLSVPAIGTVGILQGLESWNQYLWPLLVTNSDRVRPIAVVFGAYFGTGVAHWDKVSAAAVLTVVPVMVLFLSFQKTFVQSVASSAIKG